MFEDEGWQSGDGKVPSCPVDNVPPPPTVLKIIPLTKSIIVGFISLLTCRETTHNEITMRQKQTKKKLKRKIRPRGKGLLCHINWLHSFLNNVILIARCTLQQALTLQQRARQIRTTLKEFKFSRPDKINTKDDFREKCYEGHQTEWCQRVWLGD